MWLWQKKEVRVTAIPHHHHLGDSATAVRTDTLKEKTEENDEIMLGTRFDSSFCVFPMSDSREKGATNQSQKARKYDSVSGRAKRQR